MSELFYTVRSGLMTCRGTNNGTKCDLQCPYNTGKASHCIDKLMDCALALIQRQKARIDELEAARTPRLLTLDEVKALPIGAVVWLEYKAVDEDGRTDISIHPVMRSVCCGDAVLVDGECQTNIDHITMKEDACGGRRSLLDGHAIQCPARGGAVG